MSRYCSICRNTDCINHGKFITFYGDNWGCNYIPVPTNADKIRNMSDEELTEFLWNFRLEDVAMGKVGDFGPHLFRKYLKEWLQQPAEEDGRV